MNKKERARHVGRCLELAILLEASAHKPGNVNVVTNFEKTRYEHFLASAVASAPHFEFAARQGIAFSEGKIDVADVGVGRIIKDCVAEIDLWQHGGNTLLGTVILLVPIAVAAGVISGKGLFDPTRFRKILKLVVESTTPIDAVNVYKAIDIAKPSGLGEVPDLDVNNSASTTRILDQGISLFRIFKIAEEYDTICSEWVNNYRVTLDLAYPSLAKRLKADTNPSTTIVQTFLEVLAEVPDTFIARKTSLEKAREISLKAREILQLGGVETSDGRKSLLKFDQALRKRSNLLNPGTTADLVASALSICILGGYRP